MHPRFGTKYTSVFEPDLLLNMGQMVIGRQAQYASAKATTNLSCTQRTPTGVRNLDQLVNRLATDLEVVTQAEVRLAHEGTEFHEIISGQGVKRLVYPAVLGNDMADSTVQNVAKPVAMLYKRLHTDVT
jgi:hypothetical protein